MSVFNEHERQRIMAEARANLERLKDAEVRHAYEREAKAQASGLLPGERDAVQRWLDAQPVDTQPKPYRPKLDTRPRSNSEPDWSRWNNWPLPRCRGGKNFHDSDRDEFFDRSESPVSAAQTRLQAHEASRSEGDGTDLALHGYCP
jgi:hypothetical protein